MIYNTHHFKPSSFIYGSWSMMCLLCLQIFTLPFFSAWNTCCISGTDLGSGNSEIKASVSEAPRLVERQRREQLQGTIIVGGHSEESPVAMEALRTCSPASAVIPFLSSLVAPATSPRTRPVAAPSPGPPRPSSSHLQSFQFTFICPF